MDYDLGQIQCTQVSNHEIKLAANTQSKNYWLKGTQEKNNNKWL